MCKPEDRSKAGGKSRLWTHHNSDINYVISTRIFIPSTLTTTNVPTLSNMTATYSLFSDIGTLSPPPPSPPSPLLISLSVSAGCPRIKLRIGSPSAPGRQRFRLKTSMASSGNKGGPTPGPPRPEQVEGAFFRGGSSLFRAVNFELYAKGSRSVAILGSMLLLVSVGIIANIDPKPNKPSGARKRDD